jgi:phage terminase large subunit
MNDISSRYPELPHPGTRLPYGYKVSEEDPRVIVPVLEVITVLDAALDQFDNGSSIRVATDYINSLVPYDYRLSHMGLRKIHARLRPNSPKVKTTVTARKPPSKEKVLAKKKQKLADEKRSISFAKKRVEKAEIELGLRQKPTNKVESPFIISSEATEIDIPEEISEEKVIFRPHPRQAKFLSAPQQEVLYGGAAGGGKSFALLADAVRYHEHPAFNGLLLRRTNDELRELIWKSMELYTQLPGVTSKNWSDSKKTWTFPNGGHLWLTYLEQDKDVLRYQGQSFTWIGFDELTQYSTPFAWDYLRGRLRTTDKTIEPYLSQRGTTNPGGPGHGWVKKMFIDPAPYDTEFPATNIEDETVFLVPEGDPQFPPERWGTPLFYRRFIPARLSDNPSLGYQYKANLLSLPEQQRRQMLDGDWMVSDGAAFPEFRRGTHVIPKFDIPDTWMKFRSCDFGYSQKSASCVHWYAVDPDGTIYVYRELYVRGMTGDALSRKIREIEQGENIRYGMLDSSVWHVRGHNGPSIAEEMIHAGTSWRPSDRTPGARVAGKNRLHELLKIDEYTEKPGILFFDNCRHIAATLEVIPVDPDGTDDIDDKYADDHDYDSLRYGIMSRPRATSTWDTFTHGSTRPTYKPSDNTFGY